MASCPPPPLFLLDFRPTADLPLAARGAGRFRVRQGRSGRRGLFQRALPFVPVQRQELLAGVLDAALHSVSRLRRGLLPGDMKTLDCRNSEMNRRFPPQSTSTERPGPSFLHGSSVNQTVRQVPLGSTVYLDCRVKELQDYQVSIGRRTEERPINISMSWQILTFGKKWMGLE